MAHTTKARSCALAKGHEAQLTYFATRSRLEPNPYKLSASFPPQTRTKSLYRFYREITQAKDDQDDITDKSLGTACRSRSLTDECLIKAVERGVQLIGSGQGGAGGLYIWDTLLGDFDRSRALHIAGPGL